MPRFDGTGPLGQGAMTGGAKGYCAVNLSGKGFSPVRNRRLFKGGGRGYRNCFYATGLSGWMRFQKGMYFGFAQGMRSSENLNQSVSKDDELAVLKDQAQCLREELELVQSRVHELEEKQNGE